MSNLLYSYFVKKTHFDNYLTVGPNEDPYFEEIPKNELHFYQHQGAKRKRKLPQFIPKEDLKVLESVKKRAYRLDLQLSMCGARLGWAGIIGIFPWIGDAICLMFALQLLNKAEEIQGGLPATLRAKMMLNISFDFGIGLIPIIGDLIAIAYKCNSRNFILLEHYLVNKYDVEHGHGKTETAGNKVSSANEKPAAVPNGKIANGNEVKHSAGAPDEISHPVSNHPASNRPLPPR